MFVKKYKPEDWLQFENTINNYQIKITTQAIDFQESANQVLKQISNYDETLVRELYNEKNWVKLQYKHSVSVKLV
jgi:hypothetical protein